MKQQKKITFIHLLNDFSGSPLVLSNVIKGLEEQGYSCEVITSKNSEGFLSNLAGVKYNFFQYRFVENKLFRLLFFFKTQLVLFLKILFKSDSGSIIYINTLLPFGAAIAGKMRGHKIIYHIHETSLKPAIFKQFLKWVARKTSSFTIYVSDYLKETELLKGVPSQTIHNALSNNFRSEADQQLLNKTGKVGGFSALMLCSLKAYKGINEFVELARRLPAIQFNLVLNSEQNTIDQYFANNSLPSNVTLFSTQKNVHPFFARTHVVLNLSRPKEWIETFGMTLLEGMYYGLPCIAPPVGGPAELIKNGYNGYLIDSENLSKLADQIKVLSENKPLYQRLSKNAQLHSRQFNYLEKITKIEQVLNA